MNYEHHNIVVPHITLCHTPHHITPQDHNRTIRIFCSKLVRSNRERYGFHNNLIKCFMNTQIVCSTYTVRAPYVRRTYIDLSNTIQQNQTNKRLLSKMHFLIYTLTHTYTHIFMNLNILMWWQILIFKKILIYFTFYLFTACCTLTTFIFLIEVNLSKDI